MTGTKGVEFILFFKLIAVRRNTIIKRKLTLQDQALWNFGAKWQGGEG